MRHAHWLLVGLLVTAGLTGCKEQEHSNDVSGGSSGSSSSAEAPPTLNVPSGTSIEVTFNSSLSSETAEVGMPWNGTVLNGQEGIPAGSPVSGTVSAVKPARKGDRAMLDLAMTSISVNGESYSVSGETEAVVAGSTRARNLGAIAGGAAAGAVLGKAATGTKQGTIVGGVIGGATATGIVSGSKGYQVVLKPGITLMFRTTESVRVPA